MNDNKHYYAFISHSSKDEKFAIWLRDKLVNYNIPASVQREQRAPKRLRPVFIYQTDLAGANLQDALQQELNDSQWLIVICSPDGARSQYVNAEVEQFIATDRANRIIPFIVAGTPHAKDPHDECFPPALLKLAEDGTELRGVNLAESEKQLGSKMGAVVNVVATMLGVRFDSMWNVYRRKQRRQIIIAAVIAALICLAGLFTWDYLRPTYKYFADYVDKWGVPEGVVELTKEQAGHRLRTFRFEYRRTPFGEPDAWQWRLTSVQCVNSSGYLCIRNYMELAGGNRFPKVDLEYDKTTGDVTYWVVYNENNTPYMRRQMIARNGVPAAIVDLKSPNLTQGEYFAFAVTDHLGGSGAGNIVRYTYERNTDGYIIKETYHCNNDYNLANSAVADGDGIYARRFEVDELGRPVRMSYLNKDGKPMRGYMNMAAMTYAYDEFGTVKELAYWTIDDQPLITESGWSKMVRQSDQYGNVIEYRYLGTNGEPCMQLDYNYACARQIFDDKGDLVTIEHFDTEGKPCMKNGVGARWERKYNKRGQVIEESYYDTIGNLCYGGEECAILRMKYDNKGRLIEQSYFGTNKEPIVLEYDGEKYYHKKVIEYAEDRKAKTTIFSYYDTEGNPCMGGEGYSRSIRKEYISKNYTEEAYFDADGKPSSCWGIHLLKIKYDERGNNVETATFGIDSLPCTNSYLGVHLTKFIYDDRGHFIGMRFFGTDGLPCMCNNGYCYSVSEVDDKGNNISETYYDTEDNVVPLPDYAQNKNILQPAYKLLIEYTDFDKKSVETFLDSQGAVLLRRLYSYNEYNELTGISCEVYQNGKIKTTVDEDPNEGYYW